MKGFEIITRGLDHEKVPAVRVIVTVLFSDERILSSI